MLEPQIISLECFVQWLSHMLLEEKESFWSLFAQATNDRLSCAPCHMSDQYVFEHHKLVSAINVHNLGLIW